MKNPIFKDPQLQEQFERDGYVKFKFLNEEQIEALRAFYDKSRQRHEDAINQRSLHATSEIFDPEVVASVDDFVRQVMGERVDEVLQNYQVVMGSYLVKQSGGDTELLPHQDLLFVDEPDHCSFNLWVPLQPTGKGSGHIKILKGSHKIKAGIRVIPTYPWPYSDVQQMMMPYFTDVYTQLGECVAINHNVIHGSDVNTTGKARLATSLCICSGNTDLLYYFWPPGEGTDKIEKYLMKPEDYHFIEKDGRPGQGKFVGHISYSFDKIDENVFRGWLKDNFSESLWSKVKSLFKVPA